MVTSSASRLNSCRPWAASSCFSRSRHFWRAFSRLALSSLRLASILTPQTQHKHWNLLHQGATIHMICTLCFPTLLLYVWFVCVLFVPSVLWYCWLSLFTCKNCLPYKQYCVGRDVKHCSIQIQSDNMYGRHTLFCRMLAALYDENKLFVSNLQLKFTKSLHWMWQWLMTSRWLRLNSSKSSYYCTPQNEHHCCHKMHAANSTKCNSFYRTCTICILHTLFFHTVHTARECDSEGNVRISWYGYWAPQSSAISMVWYGRY